MSTLTTEPVASLLRHLFAESEASDARLRDMRSGISSNQTAQMLNTPEYRRLYSSMKDFYLAVSPETARTLYMLSRSIRARSIVEFGTSFGISTIYLAAALRDNGGGHLIGTEFEHAKVEQARANLSAAGLSDLVDVREGDALETLARNLPESIDLVLLDGAKPLYNPVLSLLEGRLRSGALIIADNTNYTTDYLERIRAADSGYISAPLGDDVELSMRK
jgi:predicted O-methyltransferase YrrM